MGSIRSTSLLGLNREQHGKRYTAPEARKFLLTSSAPALIQPEEADEFIDFVVDLSELSGEATVDKMTAPEKDLRFIDITGGILRKAACPASTAGMHPTATESANILNWNKCLRTVTMDAKFYLCDDDIQDNLTGAELEAQVKRMATDTIANEMDVMFLMWNTNHTYNDTSIVNADVLYEHDGWYRQLQFGNILNAEAVALSETQGDQTLSFHKLNCLGRAIPPKYRKDLEAFRIYMPSDMWWDYAERHQGRATALGDSAHLGPLEARHLTTPIRPLALLPTNLTQTGCASTAVADKTFMFMTKPDNLVVGVQLDIEFERERWATDRITWFMWKIRMDCLLFNEEATSLMDNMKLISCGTSACAPSVLYDKCWECIDTGVTGVNP